MAHPPAESARAMGIGARIAFTMLPIGALAVVIWLAATHHLPLSILHRWVPALGVDLAWRLDGLGMLMLLMITGVGSAVFVYTGGYMAGHPGQKRLYMLLSLFMVAMIGCVTADNLILLFIFWEATSVLSFLLVGFEHARAESRRSAQQALLVTGTGGLALLAGFILLAQQMGTASLSTIVETLPAATPTAELTLALLLILVGAFTKSAQFPFHFWLPNAMSAPTPVSAYLHSATMVKLGVYLLARLDPGFGEWPLWVFLLQTAGSVTAAGGMVLALLERDLKRILAWSTVATLGTLVALVGLRGEGAAVAVGALLLAHALYKAPLFFVAGNIDHGTGTRIIDRLGNLRQAMPWTAAAALLAGVSMAGMPLSFGYVVKDVIGAAKGADEVFALAKVANTLFSSIAVAVAGVAAVRVFWRHPGTNETPVAHEGGLALVLPPLTLAVMGIALGVFPILAQELIAGASVAMTPGSDPIVLDFAWLGGLDVGAVLASMGVTLTIGAAIFWLWDPLHRTLEEPVRKLARLGLAAQYERSLSWIPTTAAASTRTIQHGRAPAYMTLALTVATIAIGAALWVGAAQLRFPQWELPSLGVAGASLLTALGAIAAAMLRDRLVMLLGAGVVGFGSAILFLFTGAPDVAFTQFVVETVFVIVAAAVLLALRRRGHAHSVDERFPRPMALAVALGFATVLTLLLLVATADAFDPALSSYFAERSVPDAHGRNVVNVILVDFRALDTLGEISVVMLSLLAALPMLQALRDPRRRRP